MAKKITPEELEVLHAAMQIECYHRENMWQEDLSDAIASGARPGLEGACREGGDVKQPLLGF